MKVTVEEDYGFALVTVLLLLFLLTSLGLYLQIQLATQAKTASSTDSQLYSLVLAENGIEYARTLLPHVELDDLLKGPDGSLGRTRAEWRSPFSYSSARDLDPTKWEVDCDDGWPSLDGNLLLPSGYSAEQGGYFYLRFSNNSGEPADDDQDGVVLVRSAGIVPSPLPDLFRRHPRNDVTMVEAVLRQERAFYLDAPLVLFGSTGQFQVNGTSFQINGGAAPGVALISQGTLLDDFRNSLTSTQLSNLTGADLDPSIVDRTLEYLGSKTRQAIFHASFWTHFEQHVSAFTDNRQPGLFYYGAGGRLEGAFHGLLVARGDFTLAGTVDGILLHVGNGRLTLSDGTTVRGGIWMSNVQTGMQELINRPLDLVVNGEVNVIYDPARVREALSLVPPTQIGWRILFPEMKL